ncbi:MAG TPA: hypothetical protein VFC44_19500, partial [Candidatus Saccharimonadales bacterium]|nr:hypothetical protein [Candidatus Saccharimonadales bacterium]
MDGKSSNRIHDSEEFRLWNVKRRVTGGQGLWHWTIEKWSLKIYYWLSGSRPEIGWYFGKRNSKYYESYS